MIAKRCKRCRCGASTTRTLGLFVRKHRNRTVKADRENFVCVFKIRESAIMADIRTIAPNACRNNFACFWVLSDITRQ
ncbi:hypothetical protein D9M72_623790 [compost metagenome]